jgi:glycosyltransferase involved in cell wall biosynthesis
LKVLQIIDTLRPGGAEMMAVNLANAFIIQGVESHLLVTRVMGELTTRLNPGVHLYNLKKTSSFDIRAVINCISIIKRQQITHLHAHSTSIYLTWILTWFLPKVKFFWHDHYGESLGDRKTKGLNIITKRFKGIFAVNPELAKWARNKLGHKQVLYLPNFITSDNLSGSPIHSEPGKADSNANHDQTQTQIDCNTNSSHTKNTTLQAPGTFKIICVANLRPQKDHQNFILAYERLQKMLQSQQEIAGISSEKSHPGAPKISLHLIGAESDTDYVANLKKTIDDLELNHIYFYGVQQNPRALMAQADLGVLSSLSEGLPLTLLEYAQAKIPVVVTDVGACAEVVAEHGLVVPPQNPEALAEAMHEIIQNPEHAKKMATGLKSRVESHYSSHSVVPKIIEFYQGMS